MGFGMPAKLVVKILQIVNDLLNAKGVMLKSGTVVGATPITAPNLTKSSNGERESKTKPSRTGQWWYFGFKYHYWRDTKSRLVHTVRGISGAVNDVVETHSPVRDTGRAVYAAASYQCGGKRPNIKAGVKWNITTGPGKRWTLDSESR